MPKCNRCNDTGVIETGNNDLPCDCPAGDTAQFNCAGVDGPITGAEMRRHFLNVSPEPIRLGSNRIPASSLPGRQKRFTLHTEVADQYGFTDDVRASFILCTAMVVADNKKELRTSLQGVADRHGQETSKKLETALQDFTDRYRQ